MSVVQEQYETRGGSREVVAGYSLGEEFVFYASCRAIKIRLLEPGVDRANRIRCLTGTSHRRAGLEAVEGNIMSGFQGGARTAAETEASRLGRPGQSHLALLCSSVAAYL